jgi:hypothetical protein
MSNDGLTEGRTPRIFARSQSAGGDGFRANEAMTEADMLVVTTLTHLLTLFVSYLLANAWFKYREGGSSRQGMTRISVNFQFGHLL